MKVVLNCSFGENVAGETVDLKKEQALGLLKDGFAHEVSEEAKVTSSGKAGEALKVEREAHDVTKAELDMALAELAALKGAPDGKDGKTEK